MATTLFTIVHLFICFMLIIIVLLQQGKGADAGATFGGGGNTVFGSAGADNLLTKVTTFIAIAFMCTSVYLALDAKDARANKGSLMESLPSALPIQDNLPAAGTEAEVNTNQAEDVKEQAAPVNAAPVNAAPAEESAAAATSEEAGALKPESEAFSDEAKATAPEAAPAAEENVAEEQKTEDSPSQ